MDSVSGVVCGLDLGTRDVDGVCEQDLVCTYYPAGSLWCPVHGHVLDVFRPAPLTGFAILTSRGGCEWVDLSDLEGSKR